MSKSSGDQAGFGFNQAAGASENLTQFGSLSAIPAIINDQILGLQSGVGPGGALSLLGDPGNPASAGVNIESPGGDSILGGSIPGSTGASAGGGGGVPGGDKAGGGGSGRGQPAGRFGDSASAAGAGGSPVADTSRFSNIGSLADTIDAPRFDQQGIFDIAQSSQDLLGRTIESGNIDAATARQRTLFEEDFLPGLQESLGTQFGLDSGDTDTTAIALREANRASGELANLAEERQLGAGAGASQFLTGQLGLEGALRGAERGASAGGQEFEFLQQLGGMDTQSLAGGFGASANAGQGLNLSTGTNQGGKKG